MSFVCRGLTHCSECGTPLGMNRFGTCDSCEEKLKKKKQNKEKVNMSKVDEMFEKLGYKKTRDGVDCWCNYTKENEFEIAFEKNIKKIFFTNLYNAGDDEEHKAFERIILLNKEELQAINEKVKELRLE